MFWIVRSRSVTMDPCRNAKGCDDALREILCKVVLAGRLRICLIFSFWLRQEVSVVVGATRPCLVLFPGMQAVQENLRGEEACFYGLFRLRPRCMRCCRALAFA
jgi:hypothetical protein